MSTVLRTSRSMVSGHNKLVPRTGEGPQPLAYLYAEWDPELTPEDTTEPGHYDETSQTWVSPDGVITAGIRTLTGTCDDHKALWDRLADDACS